MGPPGSGCRSGRRSRAFSVTDMLAWMMFFVLFVVGHRASRPDAARAVRVPVPAASGARMSSATDVASTATEPSANRRARYAGTRSLTFLRRDRVGAVDVAARSCCCCGSWPASSATRFPTPVADDRDPGAGVPDPVRPRRPWASGTTSWSRTSWISLNAHGLALVFIIADRRPDRLRDGPLVAGAGVLHRHGHGRAGAAGLHVGAAGRHVVRVRDRAPVFCAVVSATPGLIVHVLQGTLAIPARPPGHVGCVRGAGSDTGA